LHFDRSASSRYAGALFACAAALAFREAISIAIDAPAPLLVLLAAPLVAAFHGGRGPGVFATLATAAGGLALAADEPAIASAPSAFVHVASFVALGLAVTWIVDGRARALVTARREHAALARRERRVRDALEAAPSAMLVFARDGRVTLANGEAVRLFGYGRDELAMLRLEDLLPERYRARHRGQSAGFFAAPTAGPMAPGRELHALRADGTEVPVEVGLRPLDDETGPHVLASIVDISARRAVEAARERQAALIDLSGDAISVRDFDGTITFWSRGAERLYGWTSDEAVGRAPDALYGAPTGERREAIRRDLLQLGEWSGELEHVRKDGSRLTVLSRWRLSRRTDGTPAEVLETNTDVTAVTGARDALRATGEKLQEADRRKDEFLAMLSHELRNPLAPIRAGLEVLERTEDPAVARSTRTMMRRQLGQLVRLVDDLLDVSRISTGKLHLAKERFDLDVALAHALESVRPQVAARRQVLETCEPMSAVHVYGDPVRITQVLTNLLHNASKYTAPGGRITVRTQVPEPGRVRIAVKDTGIGIDPEALDRVFELFAQLEGEPKEGLGIGLSLARQLVALHGGTLTAHSEGTDRGSTFVVELPAARTAAVAPGESSVRHGARGHRIVVADDNHDAADSLAQVLQLAGHEVHVAYDGDDAYRAVLRHRPDVAVLDIGMPNLSGYEVAERLRGTAEGRRVVLAALTGWGQEADRTRALQAGFDRHFTKPLDPARLEEMLVELERSGRLDA
jgi:PAS domain S-box-containing protein